MSAHDELEAALIELKEMVKRQTEQVDQLDRDVRQFFAELGHTQVLNEMEAAGQTVNDQQSLQPSAEKKDEVIIDSGI